MSDTNLRATLTESLSFKQRGRVSSFQSLGTVDGPGVRSVVFMQGCPLRCVCCHNPETWDFEGGDEYTAEELLEKILRYRPYFGTRGGVTVSGGEPLLQAEFVCELFALLSERGIHTALDTSGCLLNDGVKRLLDLTDLVLLDYKYTDAESYKRNTGCEKSAVDEFLACLEETGKETVLRYVVIPKLNDTDENFSVLKEISEKYSCVKGVELLPFRKLCLEKYKSMGIEFPLEDTPEAKEEFISEIYRKFEFKKM